MNECGTGAEAHKRRAASSLSRISNLVQSSAGAVAWLTEDGLFVLDGAEARKVDAQGADAGSLAFSASGRTLYWTREGSAYAASTSTGRF